MASTEGKGHLESEALGLWDVIVLALASSGPTQSVAVTLAALLATVSYAGLEDDEHHAARELAAHLGTDHHEVVLDERALSCEAEA